MVTELKQKPRRRLRLALALAVALLAACAEEELPQDRPEDAELASPAVVATEAAPQSTRMPTEMPATALAPTEAGSPAGPATEAVTRPAETPLPAATMPAASTPGAAQGTPAGQAVSPAEPVLVQSGELIGMNIAGDLDGHLGTIQDVLVNAQGEVQYVLLQQPETGSALVALDWNLVRANTTSEQLLFTGVPADVGVAPPVDLSAVAEDALVLRAQEHAVPEAVDGLLLLSRLREMELTTETDGTGGQVQELLVDVRQGHVDYAVLDFSSALGTEASIVVPWERLSIDPNAAAEPVRLDVTAETLRNAPTVDLDQLQSWLTPRESDWSEPTRDFWEDAG